MVKKKSKIRDRSKDQSCGILAPHIRIHGINTVVHAHKNGYGMGAKYPDFIGAPACANCHSFLDAHPKLITPIETLPIDVQAVLLHYEAIVRYQVELYQEGLIQTPGSL